MEIQLYGVNISISGQGSVVPWVIKAHDFILRESEVVPNLLEINYKFCKIEYVR
jgi:hypothetical protein